VGACARFTGMVRIEDVEQGIESSIPRYKEANKKAAREAFESIQT